MSHYAKVNNGIVVKVIAAEQDFVDNYVDGVPGQWIKTSYNTKGNLHWGPNGLPDGGIPLRGNFAGIGFIYDYENDVFYPPRPFPSWELDTNTWCWVSPEPYPEDGKYYTWNEPRQRWVEQANNPFNGTV